MSWHPARQKLAVQQRDEKSKTDNSEPSDKLAIVLYCDYCFGCLPGSLGARLDGNYNVLLVGGRNIKSHRPDRVVRRLVYI